MELVVPGLVNLIALLAIIIGLLLAGYWVIGLFSVQSRKKEMELPDVELPGHLHERLSGLPIFIIIFCTGMAVCMVAYVISVWVFGVSY